jgi:methylated-DNA-protein-cysteine methyltransferase-like protein
MSQKSKRLSRAFFGRVYRVVKRIPSGRVMTYGQVALRLRSWPVVVGWALHANRDQNVPCHRVVNKEGRLAPGYAFGGPNEQRNRLLTEGVKFIDDNHVKMD